MSALSRSFPDVAWLQAFRHAFPRLSEEQRARVRRRSNIYAGIKLILLGLVLPMLYVAATVMFFNDFTAKGTALVLAGSLVLIGLGLRPSGKVVEVDLEQVIRGELGCDDPLPPILVYQLEAAPRGFGENVDTGFRCIIGEQEP